MNWTSTRILVVLCVLVATGVCAAPASAGGSVGGLLDDASDGVVDGSYNAAQVRAALTLVRSDPAYMQYSDIEGVLVDYQASLTGGDSPSTQTPGSGSAGAPSGQGQTSGDESTSGSSGTSGETPGETPGDTPVQEGPSDPTDEGGLATDGSPVPSVTGWEQAKARLAAVPWFFAIGAAALIGGVAVMRRRRSG